MQTDRWVLPLNNKIETATWNGAEDEKFHGFLTDRFNRLRRAAKTSRDLFANHLSLTVRFKFLLAVLVVTN